jgi:hypothetical protein
MEFELGLERPKLPKPSKRSENFSQELSVAKFGQIFEKKKFRLPYQFLMMTTLIIQNQGNLKNH